MRKSIKLGNVLLMSSMILGLVGGTGIASASAAAVGNGNNAQTANSKVTPKGADFQTQGKLTTSGSAISGLKLEANNTVTYGTLDLDYKVKSFLSVDFNDHTTAVIKLPSEFNALAASGKLPDYITSSQFSYQIGLTSKEYNYTKDDMKVVRDGDNYLLELTNPAISGIGLSSTMDVKLTMDLGQMVTATGIRIPNAADGSAYHLGATIATKDELIDWHAVGNTEGTTTIPVAQLDPGYDLLNVKPTIETPVYDTATEVSGKGTPGAEITIKNGAGTIIGNGKVDQSGGYKIKIPAQNAGVTISVTQNTGVGESEAATTTVLHEGVQIPKPVVSQPVLAKDTTIKGTGFKEGDIITVTNYTTGKSGITVVQKDLSWAFNVPTGFMAPNDIIQVIESNSTGEKSDQTLVVVMANN
ncbi:hypothetical protein WOSG25_080040 [Weissella oryzae SG25]|uniref:Bacterial Ig domain-containing protein n=1 Tax=Weissella oryzae (strain DSM 25784 / JCM 18191 / LMG 30913 / SG25) TaxID=1329250 RepID=A0A069CUU8_WEIOS|nr:Ig-like domain-containing protein [Weissella oryzae]GAK31172.1 hypothetical protein WOSG25_080040 [Weissella oryzae SG25]